MEPMMDPRSGGWWVPDDGHPVAEDDFAPLGGCGGLLLALLLGMAVAMLVVVAWLLV